MQTIRLTAARATARLPRDTGNEMPPRVDFVAHARAEVGAAREAYEKQREDQRLGD